MELYFKDIVYGEIVLVLLVGDLNVSFWFEVFKEYYQDRYSV